MKFTLFCLFTFLFSLSIFSQRPQSEIIKKISYIQIKGDKLEQTDSVCLQINERMGDHDARIAIPYSKGDKISIGEAWIEDMKGNVVRKLKKGEIDDRSYISDISLYEDDFIKSFELKHNTYPYRILYSYKITYPRFLSIINLNYKNSKSYINEGIIVVETPFDRQIKYKQENVNEPVIETLDKSIRYTWKYDYSPTKSAEKNTSPNTYKAPAIHVVSLNFKFGIEGSFDSWQTFGNWIFRLNKGRDVLPEPEKQRINLMIAGVTDNRKKAEILYRYLQDYTRYINVSINLGGLQTYPASYVCTNKYGDCKALTNYMQSMLKYIGINSYYTLIYSSDRVTDIDPNFPANLFNHIILTIPFEKDTVFLECTSKNTPFGYTGTSTQGRKALAIDENSSFLITTPSLTLKDVLCTRKFEVDLTISEVKLTTVERGERYETSTFLTSDINSNIVNKYIRNNIPSDSFELLNYKFHKADRDSAFIVFESLFNVHNLYKQYGKNIMLLPFPINIDTYELPEKRTSDIQLDYPEYYKDTIIYELGNKRITQKPTNINIESEFGIYSLSSEEKDQKLYIYKTILIYAGRYSLDKYNDFYKFMLLVRNNETKNYLIETQ